MKYQETAVEIEREIEKFNEARRIYRFIILCLYYHVNPCKKDDCKFVLDYRKFFNQIITIKLQKN